MVTPELARDLHNTQHCIPSTRQAAAEGTFQRIHNPHQVSMIVTGDDRHVPLFSSLEKAKEKKMCDGYNDMKPPDGPIGKAFAGWVKGRGGAMAGK